MSTSTSLRTLAETETGPVNGPHGAPGDSAGTDLPGRQRSGAEGTLATGVRAG